MQICICHHARSLAIVFSSMVLAIVFSGCSDDKAAQKQDVIGGHASPYSKITIDEVLARTDYPKAAREKFEQFKKNGRKSLIVKEIDGIIRDSLINEPVMMEQVASRFVHSPVSQPSLSKLTEAIEFGYPEEPIDALRFLEGEADYMRIGVDHFLEKETYQFDVADRNSVAAFMNRVLDGPDVEFNEEIWQKILVDGEALLKKLPIQLKTEPMFHLCLAIAESRGQKMASANRRLDEVVVEFARDDYPTRMAILALRFVDMIRSEYRSKTSYEVRVAAMKHWVANDFRARGIEERYAMTDVKWYFGHAFLNKDWPALNEFIQIVETSKTLPPWFQSMVLGEYHFKLGYYYRGTGMAGTVTEEGWDKLEEHSVIAHGHLEAALAANPRFPEPAVALMGVSRVGHSDKKEKFWFEQAIKHEPDFMSAYRTRLVGLMPIWGGSVEEMTKFALEQANKNQFDTGVPYLLPAFIFMTRNLDVLETAEYNKLTSDKKLLGETIEALDGMIEHNTQFVFDGKLRDKKFLPTLRAIFLMRAGKVDLAERQYKDLDGQHSVAALIAYGGKAGSFDSLMAASSAFNAEYQEEAELLKALVEVPLEKRITNFDKIEELVENVSQSDESGGLYFQRLLEKVTLEKKYSMGEPVELRFDPQMNQWKLADNRQLTYVSETTATFDNRNDERSNQAFHGSWFPGPRMSQATFTFPDEESPLEDFAPGFLIGMAGEFTHTIGLALTGNRAHNFASPNIRTGSLVFGISHANLPPSRISFPIKNNRCELKVLAAKNYFEVYADGQFVIRCRSKFLTETAPGFAIQQNHGCKGRGVVEVSDIVVQKWAGPPSVETKGQKLIEHFENLCESDPEDKWNTFWLAHAKHAVDDFEGALPLYKQACDAGVSKQFAGFYIGDVLDRLGKRKEAFDWYLESALNTSGGGIKELMYVRPPDINVGHPVSWSAFRANWLLMTTDLNSDGEQQLSGMRKVPRGFQWLDRLCYLLRVPRDDEKQKKYRSEQLDAVEQKAQDPYKKLVSAVADLIDQDGLYNVGLEEEPLYLKLDFMTFFDSLDPQVDSNRFRGR